MLTKEQVLKQLESFLNNVVGDVLMNFNKSGDTEAAKIFTFKTSENKIDLDELDDDIYDDEESNSTIIGEIVEQYKNQAGDNLALIIYNGDDIYEYEGSNIETFVFQITEILEDEIVFLVGFHSKESGSFVLRCPVFEGEINFLKGNGGIIEYCGEAISDGDNLPYWDGITLFNYLESKIMYNSLSLHSGDVSFYLDGEDYDSQDAFDCFSLSSNLFENIPNLEDEYGVFHFFSQTRHKDTWSYPFPGDKGSWAYIIVTTKEAGGGKKDWRMGGYIRIELDEGGKPKYILEDMYDGELYEVKSCKDVQNAVVKCGAKEIKRKRALNK